MKNTSLPPSNDEFKFYCGENNELVLVFNTENERDTFRTDLDSSRPIGKVVDGKPELLFIPQFSKITMPAYKSLSRWLQYADSIVDVYLNPAYMEVQFLLAGGYNHVYDFLPPNDYVVINRISRHAVRFDSISGQLIPLHVDQKMNNRVTMFSDKKKEPEVEIPNELICPITLEVFSDPVMLLEDGNIYERAALKEWLNRKKTSPMTGKKLEHDVDVDRLTTVYPLRSLIQTFLEKNSQASSSVNSSTPK